MRSAIRTLVFVFDISGPVIAWKKDDLSQTPPPGPIENPNSVALLDGEEQFTQLGLPVLAIFNLPRSPVFRRTMEDQVHAFAR
jgi:hypothetical protein